MRDQGGLHSTPLYALRVINMHRIVHILAVERAFVAGVHRRDRAIQAPGGDGSRDFAPSLSISPSRGSALGISNSTRHLCVAITNTLLVHLLLLHAGRTTPSRTDGRRCAARTPSWQWTTPAAATRQRRPPRSSAGPSARALREPAPPRKQVRARKPSATPLCDTESRGGWPARAFSHTHASLLSPHPAGGEDVSCTSASAGVDFSWDSQAFNIPGLGSPDLSCGGPAGMVPPGGSNADSTDMFLQVGSLGCFCG